MNKNIISGIAAISMGLIYSIQSYHLPKATIGNPWAPIYFPLGIGILMVVFGSILLIQGLAQRKSHQIDGERKRLSFTYTAKLITYTSAISLIYALIFEPFGYVLSTIFFMGAILSAVNGLKQWKINLIISIGFSLSIYIVFSKFLGIILPPIPFIEF